MEYTLQSNLPLAGVGRTLTAKEWKRIYGYDVQNPTEGAEFLPQSSIEKYLNEFFKELQQFPGPWHIEDQGGNSVNVHSAEFDNFEVCAVWNAGPECLDEDLRAKCQANSKLIACAPNMLKELCRV